MIEPVKQFMDKNTKEKYLEIKKIEEERDVSRVPFLIEIMENEEDTAIKERILLLLGKLIDKTDYENIERMFLSQDAFTRNGAIEILKGNKIHLYDFLSRLSKHENKDVRKFAIDSLKDDPSEKALEIIAGRLDDTDINIRMTAAEYLGNLEALVYAPKITELLLKEDNFLFICTVLESLARMAYGKEKDKIIARFKEENNPIVLTSLIKYLGAVGMRDELELLLRIVSKNKKLAHKEFIDSIESIIARIGRENIGNDLKKLLENLLESTELPADKYEILQLLLKVEESGDKLKLAREKLKSKDIMEVLSAVEMLGELGKKEDISLLEDMAEETDSDEVLEAIGDAVTKLLSKYSE